MSSGSTPHPIAIIKFDKMKQKNIVILEGRVGEGLKYARATNGNDYCTFVLEIDSYYKEVADLTERDHSYTLVRLFIYDKHQVEYCKRVGLRQGNIVSILARLNSKGMEINGKTIIQNNVIVRDISVVKTQPDIN